MFTEGQHPCLELWALSHAKTDDDASVGALLDLL